MSDLKRKSNIGVSQMKLGLVMLIPSGIGLVYAAGANMGWMGQMLFLWGLALLAIPGAVLMLVGAVLMLVRKDQNQRAQ